MKIKKCRAKIGQLVMANLIYLQGLEDQLEDAVGVRERRGDSGFVRFGKRKMPGGIPRGKRMVG